MPWTAEALSGVLCVGPIGTSRPHCILESVARGLVHFMRAEWQVVCLHKRRQQADEFSMVGRDVLRVEGGLPA